MTDSNPYQAPSLAEEVQLPDRKAFHAEPSGLGGWLILVGLGLVLSPIRIGIGVLQIYMPLFQDGTWESLTTPGSEHYHAFWAPLLYFEIGCNLAFIVAYTVLAFLFFRKSRLFPKAYIAVSLFKLLFLFLDTWLISLMLPEEPMFDGDTVKEITRAVIGAAIWIPYMLVSVRVKNTFVK